MSTAEPPLERRARRWQRTVIVLALIGVLAAIGAWAALHWVNPGYVTRPAIGPGPIPGTVEVARVPTLEEQRGTCDGVPEPVHLIRLTKPLEITSVVFCSLGTGSPARRVVRTPSSAPLLDAFSEALAHNDTAHPAAACPAMLPMVGAFVTVVAGQQLRLAVPLDDCGFPQPDVTRAISALDASVAP